MVFGRFGVHLKDKKITRRVKTEVPKLPKIVYIPCSQHIGAPNDPVVSIGDDVKTGQIIAKNDAFVSSYIHSSISGKVIDIKPITASSGQKVKTIVIESDGNDTWVELKPIDNLGIKSQISSLKEMGIVGLGGATFPTHVKLSPPEGKKIKTILINGAECEPYLTNDNRIMIEKSKIIFEAIKILMKLTNCKNVQIGIEENKPNAIRNLSKLSRSRMFRNMEVKVKTLEKVYPQGAEKVLIHSLIGQWVPRGGVPIDIGVVVLNIATLFALYEAVTKGKPLVESNVTVTGDVKHPKNLLVRIGTPLKDIIEYCGGIKKPQKIIVGGPMMGHAQFDTDSPVTKGMGGVVVFDEFNEKDFDEQPCSKCSKCVDVCPLNLMPLFYVRLGKNKKYEAAKKIYIEDCFECGCCAYVCPCKIPIVQIIKDTKTGLRKMKK